MADFLILEFKVEKVPKKNRYYLHLTLKFSFSSQQNVGRFMSNIGSSF